MPDVEKIFVHMKNLRTGHVRVREVLAMVAFEIDGYKFYFHDDQITDGLCGCHIGTNQLMKPTMKFIDDIKEKTQSHMDEYIRRAKLIKTQSPINWKPMDVSHVTRAENMAQALRRRTRRHKNRRAAAE
ncbi:hypothetical protein HP567_012940 [Brevibacillus sp. M2.1A]|uniref:hypothetical protein n=1 Tax=Brevibacillus sp. M2.1A TaxID=2738980 RepID=UPI00156BDB46|nr:hypothetical protein [Brevibacillus sp. M2.1A]MCC8435451.1 hypothetical protein [Brevibacillus sp. M2.1A]